jgi:hypothetical protein
MLPGFRFLFAAVMLSMSLLIFGLGAAALLRAAHESFASNSSWRAAPEVPFAQRPDTTLPVLATLRVDMNAIEKANDQATVTAAPAEQQPSSIEPARNDQVAAVRPAEAPPSEPAEFAPPTPLSETSPAAETALPPVALPPLVSSVAETTTAADERRTTVAMSDATPDKSEVTGSEPIKRETAPQAEQVTAPADQTIATSETAAVPVAAAADSLPADSLAATRIATLGGPPVDVTDGTSALKSGAVKIPRARPDPDAIKKRVQARRAMHRRRLALRSRLLLQQQQANPFGQPQTFPPAVPRQ